MIRSCGSISIWIGGDSFKLFIARVKLPHPIVVG
nr:MAG TPA: hypothetical protein [Caudoviricetes sp.]